MAPVAVEAAIAASGAIPAAALAGGVVRGRKAGEDHGAIAVETAAATGATAVHANVASMDLLKLTWKS